MMKDNEHWVTISKDFITGSTRLHVILTASVSCDTTRFKQTKARPMSSLYQLSLHCIRVLCTYCVFVIRTCPYGFSTPYTIHVCVSMQYISGMTKHTEIHGTCGQRRTTYDSLVQSQTKSIGASNCKVNALNLLLIFVEDKNTKNEKTLLTFFFFRYYFMWFTMLEILLWDVIYMC